MENLKMIKTIKLIEPVVPIEPTSHIVAVPIKNEPHAVAPIKSETHTATPVKPKTHFVAKVAPKILTTAPVVVSTSADHTEHSEDLTDSESSTNAEINTPVNLITPSTGRTATVGLEPKPCKRCNVVKSVSDNFRKNKGRYENVCNACVSIRNAENRQQKSSRSAEEIEQTRNEMHPDGIKTCTKCLDEVDLDEFNADTGHQDGLQSHCRACQALGKASQPLPPRPERKFSPAADSWPDPVDSDSEILETIIKTPGELALIALRNGPRPQPARIMLTNSHLFALVSPEDEEWVNTHTWSLTKQGYVLSNDPTHLGRTTYIHQFIIENTDYNIDHINITPLDNQRFNLRKCNRSQNQANKGIQAHNTSGLKGVSLAAGSNTRWRATIMKNETSYHLGTFDSREEAALAVNEAAPNFFGEFARLNVIPPEIMATLAGRIITRTGYYGVYMYKKQWLVMFNAENLGLYPDEHQAAAAYNIHAIKRLGSNAVLNTIRVPVAVNTQHSNPQTRFEPMVSTAPKVSLAPKISPAPTVSPAPNVSLRKIRLPSIAVPSQVSVVG